MNFRSFFGVCCHHGQRPSNKFLDMHYSFGTILGPILLTFIVFNRAFSHDGMAAMMVYQTNPPGIDLYFYANTFFLFQ